MTGASARRPRAVFFGTPDFAVPCLRALCELADVACVVTQPDRPSGRGMRLTPPPVKLLAQGRGLPVLQPTKVRTADFAERLRAMSADVNVVVAYGRILPRPVLDAARLGSVNVHASLLPALRGAAPIQWSIIRGGDETGVTLMRMDEGLDTGDILTSIPTPILPEETAADLSARLSELGAQLLTTALPRYLDGELAPIAQDGSRATLAPILQKDDGRIDWSAAAPVVHALIRGTHPWPGAFSFLRGQRVKLHRAQVVVASGKQGEPGSIVRADRHAIEVACGQGLLALNELQPEGKRRMNAADFLAGWRLVPGDRFGARPEPDTAVGHT